MPIVVYCKACGKKIRVPNGPPGRSGKCPACLGEVAIPAASEEGPPQLGTVFAAAPALPLPGGEKNNTPTGIEQRATPASATVSPPAPPAVDPAENPTPREKLEPVGAPKPVRVALDYSKLNAPETGAAQSAVVEAHGKIHWDTSPDPRPSRAPLYLVLAGLALLGGGYGLWHAFWGRPEPRSSPEERKRQQFQVPESSDEIRRRFDLPGKSGKPSEKSKTPSTESE